MFADWRRPKKQSAPANSRSKRPRQSAVLFFIDHKVTNCMEVKPRTKKLRGSVCHCLQSE